MSNRLKNEKSPYLLQHAGNPVDWYPWDDEAFVTASKKDKPVFLSIGYATCHWCHVMAHESFEDEEVADLMNHAFVNIKVDREERPDIDNTYMTVCQLLTGQGGWPLNVILTPDKQPFFAATYIPKESRFNRLGMKDLVPRIQKAWEEERNKILHSTEKIVTGFRQTLELPEGSTPDSPLIEKARNELEKRFDPEEGGFGTHPKFPSPHNLIFLLQYSHSFGDETALNMVNLTLEKMRLGGLFDQIGFGFHRYSTDQKWLLPHFEKMLYDQAMLMTAYTEGWLHTGDSLYKETVYEIASYLFEQLTSDTGGFYSAEDADSEGEEGKFYVWDHDEIHALLGSEDARFIAEIYNMKPDGNFRDEATGRETGMNIPFLGKRPALMAKDLGMEEKHLAGKMESIRKKLKTARSKRPRPICDDKILTDWNGLMIGALARAGAVFEDESFIQAAENAEKFIFGTLYNADGALLHRYRDGEAAIPAMANDYAFLIRGLIELYQATFRIDYLKKALELNEHFMDSFWDKERGGVYFTADEGEKLLGRQKEIYDGALPSSNSVTAMNLLQLARLTGDTVHDERANNLFRAFSSFLHESPSGATHALHALIRTQASSAEVVVCGKTDSKSTNEMIRTVRRHLKIPYVMMLKTQKNRHKLAEAAPFTENFPVAPTPAVYLCHQFKCEKPVHSVDELKRLIERTNSQ